MPHSSPDSSLVPQAEALAKDRTELEAWATSVMTEIVEPYKTIVSMEELERVEAIIHRALQRVQAETREEAVKIAETVDPRIPTAAALADVIQRLRARKDRP